MANRFSLPICFKNILLIFKALAQISMFHNLLPMGTSNMYTFLLDECVSHVKLPRPASKTFEMHIIIVQHIG